ncbi:MAG: alanyl-tRNA editing protein [Candidatus Krumholzibacteriia bacterium]
MAGAATEKLYLRDSYTVAFDAAVVSCEPHDDGTFDVVLDKSFFYPESGGQLADRGRIAGAEVTAVTEDDAGRVHHGAATRVDAGPVRCEVDWEVRFDHMQQHTGQHVLSRAFVETADMDTISFHMGEESCTIDVDGDSLDEKVVTRVERLANSILWENRKVKIKTVSPLQVREPLLRKPLPDGVAEIRLVEIDGFDVIGCCGTHVRRVGELGLIKVSKFEKIKGANRVHFKVGARALDDYAIRHEIVKQLANRFTTAPGSVIEKVDKMHSDAQRSRKEVQRLARKLATFEAGGLLEAGEVHNGCTVVTEVLGDAGEDYLRLLSAELKKNEGTLSIVASVQGLVLCNAAADVDVDLPGPVVERARSIGGSGGGKSGFATVRLPQGAAVSPFVNEVAALLKSRVKRR